MRCVWEWTLLVPLYSTTIPTGSVLLCNAVASEVKWCLTIPVDHLAHLVRLRVVAECNDTVPMKGKSGELPPTSSRALSRLLRE